MSVAPLDVPPCTVKEVETAGELALAAETNRSNSLSNDGKG